MRAVFARSNKCLWGGLLATTLVVAGMSAPTARAADAGAKKAVEKAAKTETRAKKARAALSDAKEAVERARARLEEANSALQNARGERAAAAERAKKTLEKAVKKWKAAVKKAKADAKNYRQHEHFARQQANDASREIARAERKKSREALKDLEAVRQILRRKKEAVAEAKAAREKAEGKEATKKRAKAVKEAKKEVAEARKLVQKKRKTMREAAKRLIEDSLTSDEAGLKELAASETLEEKTLAIREAEIRLLALKAEKAEGKEAEKVRKKLYKKRALKAMEAKGWAKRRRSTAAQLHNRTSEAAKIAKRMVDAAKDKGLKRALNAFIKKEKETQAIARERIAKEKEAAASFVHEVYRWRAKAIGGLAPLSPEQWDAEKARHLLVRAGFGGTPKKVEKLAKMGLYDAVDHFVKYYRRPTDAPPLRIRPILPKDPLVGKVRGWAQRQVKRDSINGRQLREVRRWWLKRMVQTPRPLQEKLTLFWHGHFATQNSKVDNSYTMYKQNRMFREHAAGNFGALLQGIVHDPAMIRYLDNHTNVKGHPNENLGREIMQLFSMGPYQGYGEKDVREASRALTGYSFDHETGQFRYHGDKHDHGKKTIFGKTGKWTGDDLVERILKQPATSRFVARKLFAYFAHENPSGETVEKLASVLRARDYELEPMLKNLFLSKAFYSEKSMGSRIKSPVQLVVGTLRDLGVKKVTNAGMLDSAVQEMGQKLFEPPDVKGWRRGRAWISASRMFKRYNQVGKLIKSVPRPGQRGIDVLGFVKRGGCESPKKIVDYLAEACLVKPLSEKSRKKLVGFLEGLPPRPKWEEHNAAVKKKLRGALILLTSLPEFQMS